MANFTTVPKVTFINNMVITEETNVISLSQWYPEYMKKIINVSNPDYQQFPNLSQILPHYNNQNMSKGDIIYHSESTTKLMTPPQKPLSGGEEINNGDLTIPQFLTKIHQNKTYKNHPYHSPWVLGEKFG